MQPIRLQHSSGFSLVELLVAMVVIALVLGGAFALFNSMNELSRVQMHQADLQQSSRVAQREIAKVARIAGRGGLAGTNDLGPASVTPALTVRNNTGDDGGPREIAIGGGAGTPLVLQGSDVLTVRGVLETPPYQINYSDPGSFDDVARRVRISNITNTGVPQDLQAIVDAVNDDVPEALIFVSALDSTIYGVAQLDPGQSDVSAFTPGYSSQFEIEIAYLTTGGTHADDYVLLSPGGAFPGNLRSVAFVGLLEELRYYVREDFVAGGEPAEQRLRPKLSIARMFPGTENAYDNQAENLRLDLADNVFDLQVALGFDSSFDGNAAQNGHFDADADNLGDDDRIVDAENGTDDWLFNAAADETRLDQLPWSPSATPPPFPPTQPQPRLYYLRLNTLTRAARPDRGYSAPFLPSLEDHSYTTDTDDPVNGDYAELHRRQVVRTVIDLRNLG